jgi:hypothetical protein
MRWARHVAYKGQIKNSYTIWPENVKERDLLEDEGVDGEIILKSSSQSV